MNITERLKLLSTTALAGLCAAAVAAPAWAQDADDDVDEIQEVADEISQQTDDRIVITGSRLRRDTYSSVAPLQIVDAETVREAGLIDTQQILKQQTVVTGVQLDTDLNTTGGFVTNGGPGGSGVSLRGLGQDRTLILINGRRLAPSGAEGAPSAPNVNLIPSSLIQRVETLLDGASSVYGSDAIAGVQNIILRSEFDGFEIEGFASIPEEEGGRSTRFSLLYGKSFDRGSITFAAEYRNQQEILMRDRDWTYSDDGVSCALDIEFLADGTEVRTCGGSITGIEFLTLGTPLGTGPEVAPGTGFFLPVPSGTSNTYLTRSSFLEGDDNILPRTNQISIFTTADHDVDVLGHETNFYVEASYFNSRIDARSGFHGQMFPTVPATNPFNPFGAAALPVIALPIPRGNTEIDQQQTRLFGGARGAFLDESWNYETYFGYTRTTGYSRRPSILEPQLELSLRTSRDDGTGNIICGELDPISEFFSFITIENCVPVNLFAPSLYDPNNPQFATQEETDYLTGVRTVYTEIEQEIAGGFVTGDLFELPGGTVGAVFGVEWRRDGIDSGTDDNAQRGLTAAFFSDGRTIGSVWLREAYAEIELPLLSGAPFAEELTVNLAGRIVDHEFFDTTSVYSVKGAYAPVDWFTIRATYGTSFRAPNARELFLGGQSGFVGGTTDPCVVPVAAATGGVYNPANDNRSQTVINNCLAEGNALGIANLPFTLGLGGAAGIQSFRTGNQDLDPERSTTLTAGFVFEQPVFTIFDARFSFNYYDIEVEDATITPGATFIFDGCYDTSAFPTQFCGNFARDPNTGFVPSLDITPFNLSTFGTTGCARSKPALSRHR
ncbi:MAG: TonB-dependent receptor [Pseudomonadota bacterium]